jgi:hypothetical protein
MRRTPLPGQRAGGWPGVQSRIKRRDWTDDDKKRTQRVLVVFLGCALVWAALVYLGLRVL